MGLVFMTRYDSKTTPSADNDYRCHIKAYNLFNQSYGVHITPLVIDSLGGGHTNTDTYTHRGQDQFLETRHAPA